MKKIFFGLFILIFIAGCNSQTNIDNINHLSIPLNSTISKLSSMPDSPISQPETGSFFSCGSDEECIYVSNAPTTDGGACINLENVKKEIVNFGPKSDDGKNCVCKPIERYIAGAGWSKVSGRDECRTQEIRPDLRIKELTIKPYRFVKHNEKALFDIVINNIGESGCDKIVSVIDFGANSTIAELKAEWCGSLGYTEKECREDGLSYSFQPNGEYEALIDNLYDTPGNYTVNAIIYCNEPELDYSNNIITAEVYIR